LWNHRNRCVFDGATPSLGGVLGFALEESRLWAVAGAIFLGFPASPSPCSPVVWMTSSLGRLFVSTGAFVLLFWSGVVCVVTGVSPPFFLLNIMKRSSPAFSRKKKKAQHFVATVLSG